MSNKLQDLHRQLRERQCRLGTCAELTSDLDHILALAHELNNQLTAEYLRVVSESSDDAVTLAAVTKRCLGRP